MIGNMGYLQIGCAVPFRKRDGETALGIAYGEPFRGMELNRSRFNRLTFTVDHKSGDLLGMTRKATEKGHQ